MKEQRIVIAIDPDGNITADADGFKGDVCLAEVGRLLRGLSPGSRTVERKRSAGEAQVCIHKPQSMGRKA